MGHKSDWVESVRRTLFPLFHRLLEPIGLYGTGRVYDNQYVTTYHQQNYVKYPTAEEELEAIFHKIGIERNTVASYKIHDDGRTSEGSWRATHPDYVEDGMQIHITLFRPHNSGLDEIDVYAHYEDDYEHRPISHIREKNFSASEGVRRAKRLLRNKTSILNGQ